jgi:hypothetical protein
MEVKALEALHTSGHEQKAGVGGVAAALQLHQLQTLDVLGNAAQAAVGDLLAEAQVKGVQEPISCTNSWLIPLSVKL